jgi:cytochrome c
MSSYEFNKIAAAVLLAGIVAMVVGILGEEMVRPKRLAEPAYRPAGVAQVAAPAAQEAPAALEPIAPLLAAATVEAGEQQAKKCTACHTFVKGGANRVGPNLWNVVGAPKAQAAGFAYSPVLVAKKDVGWGYEELNAFLANPKGYAPGTKMAFAGLRRADERAAMIVYMRAQADSPKPLP